MESPIVSYMPHVMQRPAPVSYRLNPSGKHLWLQRLCIKLLEKLGCAVGGWEKYVEVRTVNISPLIEVIRGMMDNTRAAYRKDMKYAVVGRDVMAQLSMEDAFWMMPMSKVSDDPKIYGLRLVTIPWMSGIVLLPDLEDWR